MRRIPAGFKDGKRRKGDMYQRNGGGTWKLEKARKQILPLEPPKKNASLNCGWKLFPDSIEPESGELDELNV